MRTALGICYLCDRPAQVSAPPAAEGEQRRPMCPRHYAAELRHPRGPCRAPTCTGRGVAPHWLCKYHREQARRLGVPKDAPSELFAPREIRAKAAGRPNKAAGRPNDETIIIRLSAYAAHIIRLVGKEKSRSTQEQIAVVLEEWAGYNRPRG